jgi:hypothetical protein
MQVVDVVLHQAADQASMHLRAYMHALQLASLLQQQKVRSDASAAAPLHGGESPTNQLVGDSPPIGW